MRSVIFTTVFATLLVVTGCSTPYQSMGFRGGVEAQQITSDTYRIVARGNAYTSPTQIQDYTLLRAAETTVASGSTHFLIITGSDASRANVVTSPGFATTSVVGQTAITTWTPGSADLVIRPGSDTIIRVLPPGPPVPGAIDAQEVVRFVGTRVRRD